MKSDSAHVLPIVLLFLAGLTAFAFLIVVGRRPQMPAPLRLVLILVALAVVICVGWAIAGVFRH